jgi:hypothetical protein
MTRSFHIGRLTAYGALLLCLLSVQALGCATCGGQSDSPLALGMNMAIMTLLGVVLVVMGFIVALFVQIARRSARMTIEGDQRTPEAATRL